ncbi:MAG: glutathione S-transferase family protein [Erythrobacter sp.]
MADVRIIGTVISTYTRIVQITAEEAGLSHETIATAAQSPDNRHPFGKVPVVEVDGLELYESVAITQYLDNAHNSGALQPSDPARRAVMDKWIAIANNYLFPLFEHGLVMPYIMHRVVGQELDEARIAKALPQIARALSFCEAEIAKDGAWVREPFTLADVFMYPVLRGLQMTPQGASGISQCHSLTDWMEQMRVRPSIAATRWETEGG